MSHALPSCAEIWQAGALRAGMVIKAEDDWRNGQPQVAMQR